MKSDLLEGRVTYKSSRNIRVRTEAGEWLCSLRGRTRGGGRASGETAVVGDRVEIREVSPGEAVLERVLPRRNELRRARVLGGRDAHPGRGKRQIEKLVAANQDQVMIVLAARVPTPRFGLVDRVLVSAKYEELDAGICINKWDQVRDDPAQVERLERALRIYEGLGCPVFRTAILEGEGREALADWFRGRSTVLSGHSGVGKSTILESFCPSREIATGEVSESTGKGRHVTTASTMYEVEGEEGWLVDTPGYREYGVVDVEPAQLALYFTEMAPFVSNCRFSNCLHIREPGCGVRAAKERGEITDLRYRSYAQILGTLTS